MYRLKSIAELMLDRWFVPSAVSVHPYIEANSNVSAAVTKPGNPETQSVSIAGRRSANKGRGLFLTVAYFNARLPSAPFVCMAGWWFISPVLPLLLLAPVRPASRRLPCVFFFLSIRAAVMMTGVQGKAPTGWRFSVSSLGAEGASPSGRLPSLFSVWFFTRRRKIFCFVLFCFVLFVVVVAGDKKRCDAYRDRMRDRSPLWTSPLADVINPRGWC